MKSVFITFDQAFFERIMALLATTAVASAIGSRYRGVVPSRVSRITAAMPGPACVVPLSLWWMRLR